MSFVGRPGLNHPQQRTLDHIDDRRTPDWLFSRLHAKYGFTVDAASSNENAMLPRHWTIAENGLAQPWANEMVWCNPPYSSLRPWVEKAWSELDLVRGVVMLIPANRTEQQFWQKLVEPFRDQSGSSLATRFLPNRIRFTAPGEIAPKPNSRPPFGSCLLVWEPDNETNPDLRPAACSELFGEAVAS